MTVKDLRIEIQKILDNAPQYLLEDVLAYLQEEQKRTDSEFANSQHLKKILNEDKELLRKLAQ